MSIDPNIFKKHIFTQICIFQYALKYTYFYIPSNDYVLWMELYIDPYIYIFYVEISIFTKSLQHTQRWNFIFYVLAQHRQRSKKIKIGTTQHPAPQANAATPRKFVYK